jgi:hypothetical protein
MGLAAFNRLRQQQAAQKVVESPVNYDDITTKELKSILADKRIDYSNASDKKAIYALYLATFERG